MSSHQDSENNPRQFYDAEYHFAEDAERPDEKRIWQSLRHLQPLAGKAFFDLGCGAGWATRLAKVDGKVARAVGLDFSWTGLTLAHKHTPTGVLWVQGDGTALPIASDSIDRLFCNGALEHFPDVDRGLAEVVRVLRSGALGVLIVPNFYVKTEQPMEFRTHYWGWKQKIESHGMTIETTGTDWGPPILKNANLKRAMARFAGKVISAIPRMQYQFIFVVKKI